MNSWIQRNIIFPKLRQECPLLRRKQQPSRHLDPSPTQHYLSKKKSFNCLAPSPHKVSRKNYSLHIRNMDPLMINPNIRSPRKHLSPGSNQQSEASNAIRRRLAILGLLDEAGHLLRSNSPRNIPIKLKPLKKQSLPRLNKNLQIDTHPHTAKMQKQASNKKTLKFKTEPIQVHLLSQRHFQKYQHGTNQCLSIRKARTYDYNLLVKQEQIPKEMKRNKFSKARLAQRLKETNLKITSIRGWNNEDEGRDLMMPINSYAW